MSLILMEIHEGQIVRNLLENQFLDRMLAQGAEVGIITPAARVSSLVSRYEGNSIRFYDLGLLDGTALAAWENYELALGKFLARSGYPGLRRSIWSRLIEPVVARRAKREQAFMKKLRPNVVVCTHVSQGYGRGLIATANQMGIPTIGNLNSWDNAWKGLRVRPRLVTCWSENNKEEICQKEAYLPEQVEVIGAPAFDAYCVQDGQWSRSELCARLGINPERPILLFATLGQFKQQIDETNPLEVLLRAIDAGVIPENSQVIVRLHPWSRETYFKSLLEHPAVNVSRYESYIPGLGWAPTRAEAILAGNLMRHADVVISPGSTMSIEPSIFDTPTVVPVFNEYMPEVYEKYFRETWLNQHFGRIYQHDWLPIARSGEEMITAIKHALADRAWYGEGRSHIRHEILGPLDGKATERFAGRILQLAARETA